MTGVVLEGKQAGRVKRRSNTYRYIFCWLNAVNIRQKISSPWQRLMHAGMWVELYGIGYIVQLLKLTVFFSAVTNTANNFKVLAYILCSYGCLHVGIILRVIHTVS